MAPVLAVGHVEESIRFYRDVVGFEVASVEDDGDGVDFAVLRLGGVELMLSASGSEVDGDRGSGALGVVADDEAIGAGSGVGLVFTCDDVDVAFALLRERGADVVGPVVSDFGVRQVYVTDPDGYQSCFQGPA